jgi:hypothetical protein
MSQINHNHHPAIDPLIEYRISKLEDAVAVLSDGFAELTATIRGSKWAFTIIFGFVQPLIIGLLLYVLTRGA